MPLAKHSENVCGTLLKGLHKLPDFLCMVTRFEALDADQIFGNVEEFVSVLL